MDTEDLALDPSRDAEQKVVPGSKDSQGVVGQSMDGPAVCTSKIHLRMKGTSPLMMLVAASSGNVLHVGACLTSGTFGHGGGQPKST